MKYTIAIFTLLYCVLLTKAYKNFPEYLPRCNRYDPDVNKCLLNATELVKPYLKVGIPELNLPGLEPFFIPKIILQQGTRALNFKANLLNITVHGLTDYTFTKYDFDRENLQWICECTLNGFTMEGLYTVKGKILLAPIEGNGNFSASIDKCSVTVIQKIKLVPRRGLDFAEPIFTNSSIKVGGPKAHLEGLFGGSPELNKITNKIINDNVDELFQEIKPVLEIIISDIIADLIFKHFEDQVPFDQLYPPIK